MLIHHLYIFFDGVSVKVFGWLKKSQFVFLLLSSKSSLYVLDNNPLVDVSIANDFSKSVACLLILLILFFADQRFLILMKFSLSLVSFMDCVLGVLS